MRYLVYSVIHSVAPINPSLLTKTSFTSVIATIVYNDTTHPVLSITLQPSSTCVCGAMNFSSWIRWTAGYRWAVIYRSACRRLRKDITSLVMSVSPSPVCVLSWNSANPPDGFSWNFVLGIFTNCPDTFRFWLRSDKHKTIYTNAYIHAY